jgi:hypothetical protein
MAILVRTKGQKWFPAKRLEFKDESDLQHVLHESPDLIVTREEELPAVFIREAALRGSGFTDLLGVDALGNVLIVETKLAKNREIRREVIGQVLEYAAFLWGMSYEEFDELFKSRTGKSIADSFLEKSESISIEEILASIAGNLEQGRFKLLIAVDDINPELEKIIAYISGLRSGLMLEALEVKIYQQGETEIFVPQRHGQSIGAGSGGSPTSLTIDDVIAGAPDDHSRRLLTVLVEQWNKLGHIVQPRTAGATFQADVSGQLQPIFWAFRNRVQALMSTLQRRGVAAEVVARYRSALAALPGVDSKSMMSDARPATVFSGISEAEIRNFVSESAKVVEEWKRAAA